MSMKKFNTRLVHTLIISGVWALVVSLNSGKLFAQQEKSDALNSITPELLKPHIVKLADDNYEGRGAGYRGERSAAEYIADEFKRIGLTPAGDLVGGSRSYFQEFKFHALHPVVAWEVMTSCNVLGFV